MIGAHSKQNSTRGWLLIGLRWLAALLVLGVLLYFLPLDQLGAASRRIPATRFVAILMGYLLAHSVGILKWRMVVNAAGAKLDFPTSAECYLGGLFGTLFLPSIIGGDVVRLAVGLRRSPNPAKPNQPQSPSRRRSRSRNHQSRGRQRAPRLRCRP